jgi:hypothetical protein
MVAAVPHHASNHSANSSGGSRLSVTLPPVFSGSCAHDHLLSA